MTPSIQSYLNPGCRLLGRPQAGVIISHGSSKIDVAELTRFQKQISDYTNKMQTMSNVLRMLEDTNKGIIGNIR